MSTVVLVLQFAIGCIFAASIVGKLRSPHAFISGVRDYDVLPRHFVLPFAVVVLGTEAMLAVSHLTGWLLVVMIPIGCALLASFAVAVAVNLARRRTIPCLCFGSNYFELVSWRSFVRLLITLTVECILYAALGEVDGDRPFSRYPKFVSGSDMVSTLAWTIFFLVATMWSLSAVDVVSVFRGLLPTQRAHSSHTQN